MQTEFEATFASIDKEEMPFREAYKKVGNSLNDIPDYDAEEVLKETNHLGAAGNLNIKALEKEVAASHKEWVEKQEQFNKAIENLLK